MFTKVSQMQLILLIKIDNNNFTLCVFKIHFILLFYVLTRSTKCTEFTFLNSSARKSQISNIHTITQTKRKRGKNWFEVSSLYFIS